MQRLHRGLYGLRRKHRRAIAAAFDKRHARDLRITLQRIQCKHQRFLDQAMNHQPVFGRVNIRCSALRHHKVQAVRCDRALELMMRRARILHTRLALGVGQCAHHRLLVFRGPLIRWCDRAGHQTPRIVDEWLRCRVLHHRVSRHCGRQ